MGRLLRYVDRKHIGVCLPTLILLSLGLFSSLSYYPHSQTYFNLLIGQSRNAPDFLLGSNIDWGQNTYYLINWIKKHPDCTPLYVDYDLLYPQSIAKQFDHVTNIASVPFEELKSGWYAIGINELYAESSKYNYFRHSDFTECVANSIYIYHYVCPPLDDISPESLDRSRSGIWLSPSVKPQPR
jgi:hypothetical protein